MKSPYAIVFMLLALPFGLVFQSEAATVSPAQKLLGSVPENTFISVATSGTDSVEAFLAHTVVLQRRNSAHDLAFHGGHDFFSGQFLHGVCPKNPCQKITVQGLRTGIRGLNSTGS